MVAMLEKATPAPCGRTTCPLARTSSNGANAFDQLWLECEFIGLGLHRRIGGHSVRPGTLAYFLNEHQGWIMCMHVLSINLCC